MNIGQISVVSSDLLCVGKAIKRMFSNFDRVLLFADSALREDPSFYVGLSATFDQLEKGASSMITSLPSSSLTKEVEPPLNATSSCKTFHLPDFASKVILLPIEREHFASVMPLLLDRLNVEAQGLSKAGSFSELAGKAGAVESCFEAYLPSPKEESLKMITSEFGIQLRLTFETLDESVYTIRVVACGGSERTVETFRDRLHSLFPGFLSGLEMIPMKNTIESSHPGLGDEDLIQLVKRTMSHLDASLSQYQLDEVLTYSLI